MNVRKCEGENMTIKKDQQIKRYENLLSTWNKKLLRCEEKDFEKYLDKCILYCNKLKELKQNENTANN